MTPPKGTLYLVPTPIGNMGDITRRALEVLEAADLVACEDTRHSGALLAKLGLKKKLISYHDFNEAERARQLAGLIAEGASVAVITDAGSPGVSDPAYRIVQMAIGSGITIVPLPGATAIIPALTASGLPTDRFFFEGFLPHKSGARRKRLESLRNFEHTLVFFESPHRVVKTLADMRDVLGDRRACLAREISKKFEEFTRGTLGEIGEKLAQRSVKGEIVVIVEGTGGAEEPSCSD
jgi:16S rRNA (cytidine1402-2'-O)-methyltransferase